MFFLIRHFCGGASSESVCFCLYSVCDQLLLLSGCIRNIPDSAKGSELPSRCVGAEFFQRDLNNSLSNHLDVVHSFGQEWFVIFGGPPVIPKWVLSPSVFEKYFFESSFRQKSCQWLTAKVSLQVYHRFINRVSLFRSSAGWQSHPLLWALFFFNSPVNADKCIFA